MKPFAPIFGLIALVLAACAPQPVVSTTPAAPVAQPTPVLIPTAETGQGVLAAPNDLAKAVPTLAARASAIDAALKANPPILVLSGLDTQQTIAQNLSIKDSRFVQYVRNPQTGEALRNEIMGVYAARDSDITQATQACRTSKCYRVEMYNYAFNLATVAIVDVTAKAVLAVTQSPDTQPDISQPLKDLATKIAINSPEVLQALGAKPSEADALMASTKTSLNGTRCERSHHLCVAPTFVNAAHERALWAIVDLTDNTLVGVRWTSVTGRGPRISEQALADEVISEKYCEKDTPINRDGWTFKFILTSSDGLRISEVAFGGKPMFNSAKLVDWHVSYSQREGFGYSDAVGCPTFSSAAVVPWQAPRFDDIVLDGKKTGFSLLQEFRSLGWPLPCNYSYRQRYDFYLDGRFRMVAASIGSGCGDDGTYRPVMRIEPSGDDWSFANWDGSAWKSWVSEQWSLQKADTTYTPEGYSFRMTHADGSGYFVAPGHGQFNDGGRGDFAYSYVTRRDANKDEGASDMITIGPCCNTDYKQGPDKFIGAPPQPIDKAPIVFWVVAQLKNDDTPGREYCWARNALKNGVYTPEAFPCYAGPMFIPVK